MNQKKKSNLFYINKKVVSYGEEQKQQGWDVYNPLNCKGYDEDVSNLAVIYAEFPKMENKRVDFFYHNLENNLHLTINFLKQNFSEMYEPMKFE